MPHIAVPANTNGIESLFAFSPDTAGPIKQLMEAVMRRNGSPLPISIREIIFSHTAYRNEAMAVGKLHDIIATHYIEQSQNAFDIIHNLTRFGDTTDVRNLFGKSTDKVIALLRLSQQVTRFGQAITKDSALMAQRHGADHNEIHDTILISSLSNMITRYHDGLGASYPPAQSEEMLNKEARQIIEYGYAHTGK